MEEAYSVRLLKVIATESTMFIALTLAVMQLRRTRAANQRLLLNLSYSSSSTAIKDIDISSSL